MTQLFNKKTTTNQIPQFLRETETENEELEKDGPSAPEKVMKIGKKYALKKYDQFALNTSCLWGSTGSNITPVVCNLMKFLLQK